MRRYNMSGKYIIHVICMVYNLLKGGVVCCYAHDYKSFQNPMLFRNKMLLKTVIYIPYISCISTYIPGFHLFSSSSVSPLYQQFTIQENL